MKGLNKMPSQKTTAMELKEIRLKLSLTQAEIADKIGVSLNTYQKWEAEKFKPGKLAQKNIDAFLKEIGELR